MTRLSLAPFFSLAFVALASATCVCNSPAASPHLPATVTRLALGLTSPPPSPQVLLLLTAAIFDGWHLASSGSGPLSSVCLPSSPLSPRELMGNAAYAVLRTAYADDVATLAVLDAEMQKLGFMEPPAEGHVGVLVASALARKFRPNMMPPKYEAPNPPSDTFDADCAKLKNPDLWQPQCVQSEPGLPCVTQQIPFGPFFNASLAHAPAPEALERLVRSVGPAPKAADDQFAAELQAVLDASRGLDDRGKVEAEFFSTPAPARMLDLAVREVAARGTEVGEAVAVMFAVAVACRDAVVAAVTVKLRESSVRPLTTVQCEYGDEVVRAWKGPYLGVGEVEGGKWRPYLQTPPFPAYVSGHSTVAAAGARVLQKWFDGGVRGENCYVGKAGMSFTEPRVEKGGMGWIEGVTDTPNKGDGIGYSPAADVKVCWGRWEEFAQRLATSRVTGGIHVPADNAEGAKMGTRIGEAVIEFVEALV